MNSRGADDIIGVNAEWVYGGVRRMAKNVAIGIQNFETMILRDCFYVDKTDFIREWWENGDDVTLIARPRRFGKKKSTEGFRELIR